MEYTQNYQLPLWDKEDAVLRTDFNENNQKIDAALGNLTTAVPKIAVGTYTGNGSTSETTVVDVGFAPQMVLIWCSFSGGTDNNYKTPQYCGMAIAGNPLYSMLTLTDSGFQVKNRMQSGYPYYPVLNSTNTYFYFAIG